MRPRAVKDIMTKKLVTFQSDMRVRAAIESLLKHKISGAPVVDENGNLVGVLSEIDCMSTIIQDLYYSDSGGSVEDFMSTEITTVNSEMGLVDLAEIFQIKHFRRLPVVDNGILVGQVSRRDVLKAIQ
ncbi:MAG: CBS domain-containing protein [Candidatus Marinimicrobia bacterium]|jgi:predicted transcriptional regulator|nr:CBS domain-containing protein [Candidatus Neomarinimicrobiota bacterium]MBT4307965.1 CBS domain-containing protein [Candidatus Neomarinimicrobiota bacterium]MBT4736069.1 CBS domain-containing protein [Candidatus Neomarinimicrobiota bacterium]MBT5385494.1 CBS domain-containing protein [Candidatus Neomarinimicrobiota bacterium]MBT5996448.1 CBS domain-containing protein [Candidatus Neomarinimicrobiota bacterium]|tara:strand:- start:42 stop:425 length:384 start_codon:yes stop_codon:yes gene_type:complete